MKFFTSFSQYFCWKACTFPLKRILSLNQCKAEWTILRFFTTSQFASDFHLFHIIIQLRRLCVAIVLCHSIIYSFNIFHFFFFFFFSLWLYNRFFYSVVYFSHYVRPRGNAWLMDLSKMSLMRWLIRAKRIFLLLLCRLCAGLNAYPEY